MPAPDPLLQPFRLRHLVLKNRVMSTAHAPSYVEDGLPRLRYQLYARILRFPLPHFKKVAPGEIIPMVTAEVEPVGGFIGDSIALPAFQGGMLMVYLGFIFAQDPFLGAAAVALYPIQIWLIPKLQRRVNLLAKEATRSWSQRMQS